MARALLFSFFVFFSFGLNAQNFHEKYDIDGFMEIADYSEPKSTFKKFKLHLESQGVLFDNRFREEFEGALANNPDAMAIYKMYKKQRAARLITGRILIPTACILLGGATYIGVFWLEAPAVIPIFTVLAGAVTLPAFIPNRFEVISFLDALLIYHSAFKKQYDSNLLSQNFYEKYQIAEFFSTADLSNEKEAFKAFKAHLKNNNNVFNSSFTNEFKDAIGFTKRIPDFPSAVAYYRNFDARSRGLLYDGSSEFINALKSYHTQMGVISFKKSDSLWEQNPKGENPWD
jgi:hypothetical protein